MKCLTHVYFFSRLRGLDKGAKHIVTEFGQRLDGCLGHSTPAITATIYAHVLDETRTGAIAGLAQQLWRDA